MTGDQSRTLSVGDRVCWHNDKNDQGTITETNWAGLTIKWDNRSEQAILQQRHDASGCLQDHEKEIETRYPMRRNRLAAQYHAWSLRRKWEMEFRRDR